MLKRILLVVFLSVVAWGVFMFFRDGEKEPIHEGLTLSEWLAMYGNSLAPDPGSQVRKEQSAKAVRAIGTNALPYLIKWLDASDLNIAASDTTSHLMSRMNKNWGFRKRARTKQDLSVYGFEILGTNAASAAPELITILHGPNERAALFSARSLGHIGPAALPDFLEWFMDAGTRIKRNASEQHFSWLT